MYQTGKKPFKYLLFYKQFIIKYDMIHDNNTQNYQNKTLQSMHAI